MHYLVEVIRYGDPSLGVQFFGVFDDRDLIHQTLTEYNTYRGGKYPAYYVTPTQMNPVKMQPLSDYHRELVNIK